MRRRKRPKSGEPNKYKTDLPVKKRRIDVPNRVLIVRALRNCIACKGKQHVLYTRSEFKKLGITERNEMVRKARLCYNCLRSHRGTSCKFSNCLICQRRHNNLYIDNQSDKPDLSKPASTQSKWLIESPDRSATSLEILPYLAPQLLTSTLILGLCISP